MCCFSRPVKHVAATNIFARSSIKSLQALPLFETGAVERFGFQDEEIALAIASHSGERCHTERVRATLERLDLSIDHLRCGPHPPTDDATRDELARRGEAPSALHNNCSGKHAGFLALALHLSAPLAAYLDPASAGQSLVRDALAEMTDLGARDLVPAIDGCSAPTYRLALRALATAFARVTNPDGLAAGRRDSCRRMVAVAGRHPVLIAGSKRRIDTDLLRASGGRLFPKIGAEAVHAVGAVGKERGLAVKIDDGGSRALHALVIALLEKLDLASAGELDALRSWRDNTLHNHAGLPVGRVEPIVA